jgi:hypothetical protein
MRYVTCFIILVISACQYYPKNSVVKIEFKLLDSSGRYDSTFAAFRKQMEKLFVAYSEDRQDFRVMVEDSELPMRDESRVTDIIRISIENIKLADIGEQSRSYAQRQKKLEKDARNGAMADNLATAGILVGTTAFSLLSPVGGVIVYSHSNSGEVSAYDRNASHASCVLTVQHWRKKDNRYLVNVKGLVSIPFIEVLGYDQQIFYMKEKIKEVLQQRIAFIREPQ